MRFCLDRRVLLSLGIVGLALLVLRPSTLGPALPVLVFAACPLSMLLMMRAMAGGRSQSSEVPRSQPVDDPERLALLREELATLGVRQAEIEEQVEAIQAERSSPVAPSHSPE